MIINAGIRRVVYELGYADQLSGQMIAESGLVLDLFSSGINKETP
jgi:dCMP deaminase